MVFMIVIEKNRDGKLQHGINREAAKIYLLSSRNTDEREYMTGETILPPKQHRIIIEIAKFTG